MYKKNLNPALIMFIMGMIELLVLVGVPVGKAVLPIITVAVFAAASIAIVVMSRTFKSNKKFFFASGAAVFTALLLSGITESVCADKIVVLAIGWVMGIAIGIAGIIRTLRNKDEYRIILSIVLNSIIIAVSVITALAELLTFKGLVILETTPPKLKGQ